MNIEEEIPKGSAISHFSFIPNVSARIRFFRDFLLDENSCMVEECEIALDSIESINVHLHALPYLEVVGASILTSSHELESLHPQAIHDVAKHAGQNIFHFQLILDAGKIDVLASRIEFNILSRTPGTYVGKPPE